MAELPGTHSHGICFGERKQTPGSYYYSVGILAGLFRETLS